MREKTICFTGYRPDKLPFKIDKSDKKYKNFQNLLFDEISKQVNEGCFSFISGMAVGFDIEAAETVLLIKSGNDKIKLICAVPFREQSAAWSAEWKKRYNNILSKADKTVVLSDNYYKGCFNARNRYMVDNSDTVICFYDGQKGGTFSTLAYAHSVGREIINISDKSDKDYINFDYTAYELFDEF